MRPLQSIQYHHDPGGCRMDARLDGARAPDDARPGLLLRRHGAVEERPEHPDDELRGARAVNSNE